MRGDGRLGLLILAVGIAPALIKKSKPMAKYLGDQLERAGKYLKEGIEQDEVKAGPPPHVEAENDGAASEPVKPKAAAKPASKPKTAAKPKSSGAKTKKA